MNTHKWNIDATHSNIGFSVKHMMFTNVKGQFKNYTADIEIPADTLLGAKLEFTAKTDSIDTQNTDRDNHLKSADFFDVAQYPELRFSSQKIEGSGNQYTIEGTLEMKGISKPITLEAEYSGEMKDPWGNTKIALNLLGKINRKDFGLNWNSALETGGVLVSDTVNLDIELQLSK